MAKITISPVLRASDLILAEPAPFVAYTRDYREVTLTGAQKLQLGAVVKRAKGATGAYTVAAAADLVDTNEFAIYLADQLGEILETTGAATHKVALIVRGEIILKDKALYDAFVANGVTLTDPQKVSLKALLASNDIIVEKVLA